MISLKEFIDTLELEPVVMADRDEINLETSDVNRPGLQLSGFFDYFAADRLQVIGKAEMQYILALEPEVRKERLDKYMSYNIPVVVVCRNMPVPPEMVEAAQRHNVALLRSRLVTTRFMLQASMFIGAKLAPRITRHGVLMDVFGIGVMITGESGVGKSEAALELVKRGHQLAADDVVDICRVSDDRLVGEAPEMVRHFMEIRGIGIIDIRAMYGVGSVILSKSIDMVIHMEKWDSTKEYDRLGLTEETVSILGVKVPYQVMPVKPGRNLAIIIEVAARNLSLKRMGYSAAHELDRRLNEMIAQNSSNGDSANS